MVEEALEQDGQRAPVEVEYGFYTKARETALTKTVQKY